MLLLLYVISLTANVCKHLLCKLAVTNDAVMYTVTHSSGYTNNYEDDCKSHLIHFLMTCIFAMLLLQSSAKSESQFKAVVN